MTIRVKNAAGGEESLEWAEQRYNITYVPAMGVPVGATVWRVVELQQRVGPCGMIIHVQDEQGQPLSHIVAMQGWRDGEQQPADVAPRLGPAWWAQPEGYPNRGGGGFTNADGNLGFGWGEGEQYKPAEGEGAHWYWIMPGDNQDFSDVITGFGWLFGTNHDHLEITFQRSVGSDEPQPEPGNELERMAKALETIARWFER